MGISLSCRVFKILQPALRECALVSHLFFITKRCRFSVVKVPVMDFPSVHNAVNNVHNILSSCANLGGCTVCHLKRLLKFLLDAMNNHHWSFCSLCHRHSMIQFCMKPRPQFGVCHWQASYLVQDSEEVL